MKIAIVDDEKHAVEKVRSILEEISPNSEVHAFFLASDLLYYLKDNEVDVVFLDVEMPEMSGLELTINIKDLCPKTNIIFVTGHSKYALEAHGLYVSAFLLKPVNREKVKEALEHLRPLVVPKLKHIYVQTFGNFDVFVDGEPLTFPRSKSKELLAYLIDCRGTGATSAEIAAVLWEDKPYNRATQNQTQKIITVMMQTLRSAGIGDIIIRKRNNIMVNITKIECDYYDFLKWDTRFYRGQYMKCYSWAEITSAVLSENILK